MELETPNQKQCQMCQRPLYNTYIYAPYWDVYFCTDKCYIDWIEDDKQWKE